MHYPYGKIALSALITVAALLFNPLATGAETGPAKGWKDPGAEVILRVNGRQFTRENLNIAVNNMMPMVSFHSSTSPERYKKLQRQALDNMINDELIYKSGRDLKTINVTDKDIDAEIEEIKKNLPKKQTLEEVLKRSKMTMAELREHFLQKLSVRRMKALKTEEIKKNAESGVTDAYMKDYYRKNLTKFVEPEQIHLRSILIKADPSGGTKIWNEAFKKAKDIVKMAREGQDFAELAKKYSQDVNATNGGDMGWSHVGSLFEEIEAGAADMKVGNVSEPVTTIYGYHILKLEGKKPSVQKKYEEINTDKLRGELVKKERNAQWQAWIDSLRAKAEIEILALDLKPKKEGAEPKKGVSTEEAPLKH